MTATTTDYERLEREYFREYFLSVDRFFLLNQDAFVQAFEKLKSMVSVGDSLAVILALYVRAVASGAFEEQSVLQTMPRICAVPILTVYLHLSTGAALFINDLLMAAWTLGDGTPGQCVHCGLRVPVSPAVEVCPNCDGKIGPAGAWDGWVFVNRVMN